MGVEAITSVCVRPHKILRRGRQGTWLFDKLGSRQLLALAISRDRSATLRETSRATVDGDLPTRDRGRLRYRWRGSRLFLAVSQGRAQTTCRLRRNLSSSRKTRRFAKASELQERATAIGRSTATVGRGFMGYFVFFCDFAAGALRRRRAACGRMIGGVAGRGSFKSRMKGTRCSWSSSTSSAMPGVGQLAADDVAARVDPLVHQARRHAEQMGEQLVHFLFELAEVAGPFGRFREADVFFALPAHRMEQHHAVGRDDPPLAGGERPERGRRAFAGDDARGLDVAELDQRHQRDGAIRAAARRIEVDRALAARLDAQQAVGQFGFAVGQIADDRNFDRLFFVDDAFAWSCSSSLTNHTAQLRSCAAWRDGMKPIAGNFWHDSHFRKGVPTLPVLSRRFWPVARHSQRSPAANSAQSAPANWRPAGHGNDFLVIRSAEDCGQTPPESPPLVLLAGACARPIMGC